jgi:hypothetical protein
VIVKCSKCLEEFELPRGEHVDHYCQATHGWERWLNAGPLDEVVEKT